ncbi:MAG TPA: Ig-like domain-containing protein, partial [Nitrososphaeraceae archaeon]|nr:Ig-like domain-containing protein [Nitrososphaeraceae archaeon]
MRFSDMLVSNLYLIVIFAILSYVLGGFPSFSELDQIRTDVKIAFGQLDDGEKGNDDNPNTTLNTAIDGNNNVIANNGSTISNSMKFAFSGTDSKGVTINRFECSMDGEPFVTCISTNTVNVADGTHTFSVRSHDAAVNKDITPASFTWTVNTESSNTQIDSATDGNKMAIINNSNTRSNSMTFAFSGTDNEGATINRFECSMDGEPFVTCVSTNTVNVADGTHTFSVTSQDAARNKDLTPASFTWTVDTTAPTTSIISAIDGNNKTISNNDNSESTSIRFAFSSNDTGGVGVDHLQCNIDNSKYVACTSPFIFSNVIKDGTHTFKVRAQDIVGNISPSPASFTWVVDTVSPTTTIHAATDGNKTNLTNSTNTNSDSMSFKFSGNDTGGNEGKGVGINHFECNIDNSKYVACSSPFIFSNLIKDGTHTFTVLSEDNIGNKDSTPASFRWTVDTLAPLISINTATDGNSNFMTNGSSTSSNSMTFIFSGNDTDGKQGKGVGIKQFECSLDGASFSICTSPVKLTSVNLPEGTHTFEIMAEDSIGNINSSPESFTWTVDTEPPITTIDSSTDGYKNVVTNGGNTHSNSIIFAFSAKDSGGIEGNGVGIKQFECNIDNSDFASCSNPLQFKNLGDGTHTLEIISEDNVGNISPTPASYSWTIDTLPPTTTISTAIDGNESSIANGSNTRFNSVAFTFAANDTGGNEGKGVGIRKYECSLDNSNFTTCTSPLQFTSIHITPGTHTFEVLSEDNVGNNDPSPTSFNWTVDTIAPTTTINTAIDENRSAITNGTNTKSNSVTFQFSGNDTGGAGVSNFECSLDGASFTTCTSPVQLTPANITDGTHTFDVSSEDNSTNKDPSPASFTWTVDTVPPETSILSATDDNESIITAGQNTSSNYVAFEFSSNDTGGVGVDHLECSLDGAPFTTCTSPVQLTPANITDGTHTFDVSSEDNSTNKDPSPASFTWYVDTTTPTTTINTAIDGNRSAIINGTNTKSNSVTFEFSSNDTGGVGVNHLECSLDGAPFTTCTSPVQLTPANIFDGAHTFMLIAQDKVGNIMTTPVLFNWTVDTSPPITTINTAIDGNKSRIINDGSTKSVSMTFTFSANDTGGSEDKGVGIKQFECSIDNSNFTLCTSPIQSNNLTDGNHTLDILSEDKLGNRGSAPTFDWTIDTKSPSTSIFSATDGNNNFMIPGGNTSSNSVTFEFSANDTGGS